MKMRPHRFHRVSSPLAAIFLLPLLLIVAGCGQVMTAQSDPAAAPTVAITPSPVSISAGGSSTLNVSATNATQVTVTGSDGSSYNLSATGGTQGVSPSATATYTATATGAEGNATATAKVTVSAQPPPAGAPTVTITAHPASITAGDTSTLTVSATNATQVTVTGSDGSSYNLSATGGTQAVSPSETATYTATATGSGGKATATATVTVSAPPPPAAPKVTITANPTSIAPGGSSTLTVSATKATQVTVSGSDGSSYYLVGDWWHASCQSLGNRYLYRDRHRRGRQGHRDSYRERRRYPATGADRRHHRESHFDCSRRLVHSHCDRDECERRHHHWL